MSGLSEHFTDELKIKESIKSAEFDAFAKGVGLFATTLKPKKILIQQSQMLEKDERTIYRIDFSSVFPTRKTMAFLNIKEEITSLQDLSGNSDILLLEDDSKYYLVGDSAILTLTKYRATIPKITLPNLHQSDQMGETVTISDTENTTRAIRGSKWAGLFIHAGQLSGFITSNSVLRLFEADSCNDVIGKLPECVFKAFSFLKMAGSSADLVLYKAEGQFWLKTTTNFGKKRKGGKKRKINSIGPVVTIFERLMPAGLSDFPRLLTLLSKTN